MGFLFHTLPKRFIGFCLLPLPSKTHANLQRSTFNKELRFLLRELCHAFGLESRSLATVVMVFGRLFLFSPIINPIIKL